MAKNAAREILWPTGTNVLVRVCFLYVGQGSSIIVLVRDGSTYRAILVDSNLDKANGGIDVPALVKDLLPDGKLYAFVNTHPHDDHLKGVKEVSETVTVERVWHTGFNPGEKSGNHYEDLEDLIADVKKRNGTTAVIVLRGSKFATTLLDAEVYTLAPADHVKDDIEDGDADARYCRIHEYCAVLRFGKGKSWILITGDADLAAFRDHITEYHKDRLPSYVLDASHHGSRSFFIDKEGDNPYLDALEAIDPDHVVISAPTQDESQHEHPHDDAVKIYKDHVGKKNVLHTGKDRETFFFDIYENETTSKPQSDGGDLAEAYGLDKDDDGGDGGGSGSRFVKASGPFKRPSGPGVREPGKWA
ncbi:ComEC/Rec2 family competence protein [Sorangium sp. So ce1000]|uniref:ComEC/Rec2 family competence protein n=1 Tax=Sorangium sp. So ce1000 TaxID=3133325 RepID=UPI003F61B389